MRYPPHPITSHHFLHFTHHLVPLAHHYRHLLILLFAPHLIRTLVTSYKSYTSLGLGGFPRNPFGWALSSFLKPFGLDTVSLAPHIKPGLDSRSYLPSNGLSPRSGPRPRIGGFPVPHRQVDQIASTADVAAVQELLRKFQNRFKATIELRTSVHEGHGQALFVKPEVGLHKTAKLALREIAHVHPSDGSLHVVLSPKDAAEVVRKGWGERHPLSGWVVAGRWGLPSEYLMVYAPRTKGELEVLGGILGAGCRWMMAGPEKV